MDLKISMQLSASFRFEVFKRWLPNLGVKVRIRVRVKALVNFLTLGLRLELGLGLKLFFTS